MIKLKVVVRVILMMLCIIIKANWLFDARGLMLDHFSFIITITQKIKIALLVNYCSSAFQEVGPGIKAP